MDDLVFVSMEDWDTIWRRNQFLCAHLAKRYPNSKILFVGLPHNVPNLLRQRKIKQAFGTVTFNLQDYPSITITNPPKYFPDSITLGRYLNEFVMRGHIKSVSRRIGIKNPILWLNPHYAVHMVSKMQECGVIYDITDDWTSLTQSEELKARTIAQDRELCRVADAVIVCSQRLFEIKQGLARNLHLIPNGVDAKHYAEVLDKSLPLLQETRTWSRPVLGYTGTIHPDRINLSLLEKLARGLQGSIILIGPNHLSAKETARLQQLDNLKFLDAVPYQNLPAYMRSFDILIVPHLLTPFTESLNPIKLWEYLAAGKPIISTPVAGFRDYSSLVYLAKDSDDFLEFIEPALQESSERSRLRQQEAHAHSWEHRLDEVEAVIKSCIHK